MTSLVGSVLSYVTPEKEVSDHAKTVQNIFNNYTAGQEFFDLVYAWFENYDQHIQYLRNKSFYTDVKFIIQLAAESLKTSEDLHLFPQRVDTYLYMFHRINEYIASQGRPIDQMNEFRKILLERLGSEFKSSEGANPNFCIKEREMMKKIDVKQHLSAFTDINCIQTLMNFFAMCKLAFQSSQIVEETNCLQWKDALTTTKQWKISLQDFVSQYTQYKESFTQFPFDASAFVYLIRVMYPSKSKHPISFEIFRDTLTKLKLDYQAFFSEYCVLFGENVKQTFYEYDYIDTLLVVLRSLNNDDLFGTYLQTYALNTNFNKFWGLVLHFSQNHDLSDQMQHALAPILKAQAEKMSLPMFNDCCQMTKNTVQKIRPQNRARTARVLQILFYAFLHKKIYFEQNFHPLDEGLAKELLSLLLELSWPLDAQNPFCLFVIEHLIFTLYDHTKDKFQKLKRLFQRLNQLNEKICTNNKPVKFIQDCWLNDYVCDTPCDWLKLNRDDYQNLCEIHQNNGWSLYVWSKFVYSSVSNVDINFSNEILVQLNQWIVEVRHDKYQDNDPLTTIFVNSVFECVIFKHSKSLLSLPDIQSMIRYILHARDAKSRWINKEKIDEFVETVQRSIRDVLLLESEPICLFLFFMFYNHERLPSKSKFCLVFLGRITGIEQCNCSSNYSLKLFLRKTIHIGGNCFRTCNDCLSFLGTCVIYHQLIQPSVVHYFLPFIDLKAVFNTVDLSQYKFPITKSHINAIMGAHNPDNINISEVEPIEKIFDRLVQQVNIWLNWFEKFADIFLYIIEWLKNYKMEKADDLYREIYRIRNDSAMTLRNMKTVIQDILKVFEYFNHLPRLCDLFNCTQSFEVIDPGTLSNPDQQKPFIEETKQFRPDDTFKLNPNTETDRLHRIDDRRHVRWSLVCEQYPFHVTIEYQVNGLLNEVYILHSQTYTYPAEGVLRGEFKTQRGGHLRMIIKNLTRQLQYTVWFEVKSNALSRCHLFNGIFNIHYQKHFNSSNTVIKKNDLSKTMDQVFLFIDNLLDGSISLAEMDELRMVFHDKNINVREEVQKLFASQPITSNILLPATTVTSTTNNISRNEKIEQVDKWLQTYQYYSHVNIIINCVQKFNIISTVTNDHSMDHLQGLTIDINRSLKEISHTYNDVYRRFQKLTGEHLQLIKTMVACPNVVEMMKNSKLYSPDGLRRFQALRDTLTTQFQLQERNNMILNSWIITFTLCEPFVHNARDLEEFVDNLAHLRKIDDNSCEHIKSRR
ncbi:unnamed protein product [Rotaria magnacalcarata]|nr:unnamed protein product [Rotaria magnacalcarata]CAF4057938.1 unnamed protein product [Rotaria magnacalcarata]CAF4105535.1 unnamed protein product [Rotaria magnacalcarata]